MAQESEVEKNSVKVECIFAFPIDFMYKTESNFPQINKFCESFIKDMKKIKKDLQSRSFKLYYHINNSFFAKIHPYSQF